MINSLAILALATMTVALLVGIWVIVFRDWKDM